MVGGMLSQGQYLVNPVAAMPSLHTAYATLAAGFFWFGKSWWQKAAARLLPLRHGLHACSTAASTTCVDEIAGAAYAARAVIAALARWLRAPTAISGQRAGRRRRPTPRW